MIASHLHHDELEVVFDLAAIVELAEVREADTICVAKYNVVLIEAVKVSVAHLELDGEMFAIAMSEDLEIDKTSKSK